MEPIPACAPDIFRIDIENDDILDITTEEEQQEPKERRTFKCTVSNCEFECTRHLEFRCHEELEHKCLNCGLFFPSKKGHPCQGRILYGAGVPVAIRNIPPGLNMGMFSIKHSAHGSSALVFETQFNNTKFGSFEAAFTYVNEDLVRLMESFIDFHHGVRIKISLNTTLEKISDAMKKDFPFTGPLVTYTHKPFIKSGIQTSYNYLQVSLEMYTETGSGWRLKDIKSMEIQMLAYQPRFRRGYGYIPLPRNLLYNGILNIKGETGCFAASVVAGLYGVHLPDEPNTPWLELEEKQRKRLKRLQENPKSYEPIIQNLISSGEMNFEGFLDGVAVEEVPYFEDLNQVSISVYGHDGTDYHPIYTSKKGFTKHVHLLKLSNGDLDHYCLITKLGKLAAKANHRETDMCPGCFGRFHGQGFLLHLAKCQERNKERPYTFPKEKFYTFNHHQMLSTVNFKIYFQFLKYSCSQPYDENNSQILKYTTPEGNANVAGYSVVIVDYKNELWFQETFVGEFAMERFMKTLIKQSNHLNRLVLNTNVAKIVTPEVQFQLDNETICPICHKEYTTVGLQKKHIHHHHLGDQYQKTTVTCGACNIRIRKVALVGLAHGLKTKKGPTILKSLNPIWISRLYICGKDTNNILALTFRRICRIIDSKSFLDRPLHELVERLHTKCRSQPIEKKFGIILQGLQDLPPAAASELTKYIAFPENTLSNTNMLSQSIDFPTIEVFSQDLPYAVYQHTGKFLKNITTPFSWKNYTELYLRSATLQLAQVMTNFDMFFMDNLGCSPLHDVTLAAFANHVCFYISQEQFEYVKDPNIVQFVERGVRGGIETSNIRLAMANSERLQIQNVTSENRQEILSIDLNGIYGHCLTFPMAQHSYRWMSEDEIQKMNFNALQGLLSVPEGKGYILEVDLYYPERLHEDHDGLPMAVEKATLHQNDLSDYQQEISRNIYSHVKMPFGKARLSLNLNDKTNYIVYYKNLQYYIEKGLEVKRIYNVLEFFETSYFKTPMEKLTALKLQATVQGDEIWAGIIKQMICSTYGYLLTSSRDFANMKPCTSQVEFLHMNAGHSVQSWQPNTEDVSFFQTRHGSIHIKNPIICGFMVLELSKLHLYKGYDMIRANFPSAKLIMAQTDSLSFAIKDPNGLFLETLQRLKDHFDFSNLPLNTNDQPHVLYSLDNQGKPGKWKIVDFYIVEIISLRIKQYSYISACSKCFGINAFRSDCDRCFANSRGKLCVPGIPRAILNNTDHDFFRQLLSSDQIVKLTATGEKTIYLSHSLNIGRHLNNDKIHTTAFGNICLRK